MRQILCFISNMCKDLPNFPSEKSIKLILYWENCKNRKKSNKNGLQNWTSLKLRRKGRTINKQGISPENITHKWSSLLLLLTFRKIFTFTERPFNLFLGAFIELADLNLLQLKRLLRFCQSIVVFVLWIIDMYACKRKYDSIKCIFLDSKN